MTEGQKSLLVAIQNAIENLEGAMTEQQKYVITRAIQKVWGSLSLTFDEAVDEVIKLEDAGFEIESELLGAFMELAG